MAKTAHEVFTESVRLPFHGLTKRTMTGWMAKLCGALELENASISLILTTDARIQEINKRYRKKNKPTDVISFAYRDEPFPRVPGETEALGDVYISLERAEAQALRCGVSAENEFRRLLVHGVLHLAGFDHERSRKDARSMRLREDDLLALL